MYRWLIRPLLFWVPAEWAHSLAFAALRWVRALPGGPQLLRAVWGFLEPGLEVQALGLRFASPVVLAAGFDKHATGYAALLDLGFGGVEVGTITNEAQSGNPRPRLFRLARDRALLNRMGFNNCGAEQAERHLRGPRHGVVGVNIGKTKRVPESEAIADYAASARRLAPLADYLVVNVSSPNTPGLRDLQAAEKLRPLLQAVQAELRGSSAGGAPRCWSRSPRISRMRIFSASPIWPWSSGSTASSRRTPPFRARASRLPQPLSKLWARAGSRVLPCVRERSRSYGSCVRALAHG